MWLTISRIVRSPRPSSPTSRATAPSSAISADAFERLPSLSFSRSIRKPGCGRSSRKHESPAGACASTRKASLIGAEQNHLCPSSSQTSPAARAAVSFARTSEPPCRSVIAIPQSASPLVSRGIHSDARSGCVRSARDGRERHRERTADTRLDLAEQHEQRRSRDLRAATLVDPRQRLHPRLQPELEQRVPGGVELDLVDLLAVAVVRAEPGRMLVREPAPLERIAAEQLPERRHLLLPVTAAFAAERLDERRVLLVEVVVRERRRLVAAARPDDGHQAGGTFWLKRSVFAGS